MADDDYVHATCHACEGAGCTYCDSRGWVEVRPPATACPHCEGDCCIYCGFTGWAGLRPKYEDEETAGVRRCDQSGCCD